MIKKYVLIVFFFFSYSIMAIHPYADYELLKENNDVKNNNSDEVSDSLKKQLDVDKADEELDLLIKQEDADEKEIFEEPNDQEDGLDSDLNCTKDIPYTPAQKRRLDQIYHRIYMDYINLIETYAWAGALTQDQKVLRYNMLKNYILTFQKRNYKWCSEHEEDEWEEEWYNNDND